MQSNNEITDINEIIKDRINKTKSMFTNNNIVNEYTQNFQNSTYNVIAKCCDKENAIFIKNINKSDVKKIIAVP